MEKNHKIIHSKLVTIDEDERECLRRLAETSNNTTRGYHQNFKPVTNDKKFISNKVVKDIHIVGDNHLVQEKKKVMHLPNNKLESKKSEDINESAEKFIQKFKQQLLLQRLESIENVEKMLERGL
ncbi:hypothetical protein BVRB_9g219770 [Beta vulgaris subsp. vulgaris]|uniref:uncharacterized protein LOC104904576 n=1 Tax=Beta vulgaris subsp. vulgaris TaxID=3555 RepID=UPI00054036A3|nr:uncharacterized protein LOC104904576 [Beta vulgaris subsp. vulgaris]KMT00689.1 hypothetical protein BVRB_9g219770 [Beta vulgaris subsp. vulgaris]